jgi:SAM-dependent methyltransferase
MRQTKMVNPISPLPHSDWFLTPAGRYMAQWSLQTADSLLLDVFGLQAVQIGCETLDFLAHNRIQHRFRCTETPVPAVPARAADTPVAVQTDPVALPFATDSLDLVVLPYILEFNANPHQVLRESYRILRPEGQLLILGFNPHSVWGLRNTLSHALRPSATAFPWPGNYLSVHRLKDWLKLLDFEVARGHFGCYAPPCRSERSFEHLHWLELAGDRWWGFAGGCYALTAIKRIAGMTLITPNWLTPEKKIAPKTSLVTEQQMPNS